MTSHRVVITAAIILCTAVGLWALGAGSYVLAAVVGGRAAGLSYYLRGLGSSPAPLDALLPVQDGAVKDLLTFGSALLTAVLPLAVLVVLPALLRRFHPR